MKVSKITVRNDSQLRSKLNKNEGYRRKMRDTIDSLSQ